jgi:hypothetical protein
MYVACKAALGAPPFFSDKLLAPDLPWPIKAQEWNFTSTLAPDTS